MATLKQLRKEQGLCISCAEPRGEDGTSLYCRSHADDRARKEGQRLARLRRVRRKRGQCIVCGTNVPKGTLCRVHRIMQSQADARHYRLRGSSG